VEAEVRNIAYPLAESPSPVVFGGAFDGAILSGQLNAKGELNMKTKAMQLRLDGQKVVLLNLDEKGKGPFARAETMSMNIAAPAGAASYTISDLSLVKPYLRVEADRQGEYINPFDEIEPVTSESKGSKPGSDPRSASPSASDASAVLVQKLTVTDGTLHYYNGKVATPAHLTRIEGVSFTIDAFAYPFSDKPSNYIFAGHVPGRTSGAVSSSGWTILKNKDTDAKVTVRGLDITQVKPYYHKKGDTDIEQGAMNLDMDLKVKSRMLNAPGRMVLRDLVFASGKGTADKIIGVPKAMVVDLLKSKNGEISLDFTLEGSLDDPKFSMRESLMKRLTAGLAGQLGLPISEIGEAVVGLGKQGVEQTTRSVRGIGEGLQKLFKR
ncbi:MAG TPA: DUF748 domain-containing protein, partial [Dissulfurispiraceae bacterium]|nr:DUF748 domain-containing protein [Dissulfurispiraceae bacterium]